MQIEPVSLPQLTILHNKLCGPSPVGRRTSPDRGGVEYQMGAKADQVKPWQSLSVDSSEILTLDCSGYVRYTAYKCSGAQCELPDGSQNQREACAEAHLQSFQYATAAAFLKSHPDRLFICFLRPARGEAGHVWWMHWDDGRRMAMTLECHGNSADGSGGVDSRPFTHGRLAWCRDAFLFPSTD